MSLAEWDALKKVAAAQKTSVIKLATTALMEAVRDTLAAQPDLSKVWSDDITNKAAPAYKAKVDAIAMQGGWTAGQ
jgi:chromosomal replication initiation ATPase DnaA